MKPARKHSARPRRRSAGKRRKAWTIALVLLAAIALPLGGLWIWAILPGPGGGEPVELAWPSSVSASEAGELLHARGLLASPKLFALYVRLVRPSLDFDEGSHLLNDALSPRELVQRLARLRARPTLKIAVPEGWNMFQIAERLEENQICARGAFLSAARSDSLRRELGIRGESVEGFLFPATYELGVDSSADSVIRAMVRTQRKRLHKLDKEHGGAIARLLAERGFSEHEIVTLASIVEKEARHEDEAKTIASVYFNRLDDPDFRPRRTLMADPTAGYGCLIEPDRAASCKRYAGRITPAMLRDADNRYNTYKHAGLPPGPIANPGERALRAVLAPARTNYLFFVANGDGRHVFSRTLDEHNDAIRRPSAPRR